MHTSKPLHNRTQITQQERQLVSILTIDFEQSEHHITGNHNHKVTVITINSQF